MKVDYSQPLMSYFSQMDALIGSSTKAACGQYPYHFLVKNGFFCNPALLPAGFDRGEVKKCFQNSFRLLATHDNLTYVEGVAAASTVKDFHPVPHGWCIDNDRNVIDVTFKQPGLVYFGIPFDELFALAHSSKHKTPILWEKSIFEAMNDPTIEFIRARWKEEVKKEGEKNLQLYQRQGKGNG